MGPACSFGGDDAEGGNGEARLLHASGTCRILTETEGSARIKVPAGQRAEYKKHLDRFWKYGFLPRFVFSRIDLTCLLIRKHEIVQ